MRTSKKIVSLVLAVMMVVSMMSVMAVSVSAATAQVVNEDDPDANVMYTNAAGTTVKYYTQFPTLSAGTYKVLKDFTQTVRAATGTFGATYTIDLNKKTVTFDVEADGFSFCISHRGGTATITNGGKMICADNSEDDRVFNLAGGTLNIESSVTVEGTGNVTPVVVTKGTLNTAGKLYAEDSFAIATNGADSKNFVINVTGGTVKSTNATAIYQPADGELNISGGTITGTTGVYVKSGTTNITGGTIKGTGAAAAYDYYGNGANSTGDALVVDNCGYPGGTPEVNVNGGTFTSTNADAIASYKKSDDPEYSTDTNEQVTGFVKQATLSKGTADAVLYDANLYDIDTTTNTATPKTLTDEISWEWVASDNASYQYKAKMTVTVGGEEYYTTTVSPTIKAENGELIYTATAKYAGITYTAPEKNVGSTIKVSAEISKAAAAGGEWSLGNDISNVGGTTVADGFKLNGNGYKLTANTSVIPKNYMFTCKDANTKFELNDVTLDGSNGRYGAVSAYTGNGGNNPGNVITLNNVTIQNFNNKADYTGAVYAFGSSTVNLNDCTIVGNKNKTTNVKVNGEAISDAAAAANSGKAVWAGAKATVNINGGTYDEVLLHGGTANTTVEGGATVDTVRFGFTKSTEDSTKMKATINDATVLEVVSYTDFAPENVVIDESQATVGTPEGYIWVDSAETGMKTLAPAFVIEGYQNKASQADADGSGVRILTKVDNNYLEGATYGYVIAKVTGKAQATANFANMKANGGNGEKTIDCTGTFNNGIDGIDNTYVTLAVNGMSDGDQVAVRFFVTKGGVTTYANYVNVVSYDGIIATYTA
ncbi:MAG: hypothetical protein IJT79_06630 [Ruminococcus sp.]|nr:hypothetical protein [Ruminococcus sp.]